jgi:hypothetical protein
LIKIGEKTRRWMERRMRSHAGASMPLYWAEIKFVKIHRFFKKLLDAMFSRFSFFEEKRKPRNKTQRQPV